MKGALASVIAAILVCDSVQAHDGWLEPMPYLSDAPFAIVVSHYGAHIPGGWWLSINAAGDALLHVFDWPAVRSERLLIDSEKMHELRELIDQQKIFELQNAYGYQFPGGSTMTVSVIMGRRSKSINIDYVEIEYDYDRDEILGAERVLQIFRYIRSLLTDEALFDNLPYVEKIIDKAIELESSGAEAQEREGSHLQIQEVNDGQ